MAAIDALGSSVRSRDLDTCYIDIHIAGAAVAALDTPRLRARRRNGVIR